LLGNGTFTGNIIPSGNATQSLGNATNQWKDLWVSNNTIYINSIPLGVGNTGVLQFDGNDIVTSGPNVVNTGNVETTGNVVGGNLVITAGGGVTFADGSIQTSAYGNANVEAYLPNSNTIIAINSNVANTNNNVANLTVVVDSNSNAIANLTVVVDSNSNAIANLQGVVYTNSNVTTLLSSGNIVTDIITTTNVSAGGTIYGANVETSGNVLANVFNLVNEGNLVLSSIQRNQNPPLGTESLGIEMLTQITDDAGIYSSVSAGPSYAGIKSSNAGNADVIVQGGYGATIKTSNVSGGSIKEWSFLASGNTITPGNVSVNGNITMPNGGGDVSITAPDNNLIINANNYVYIDSLGTGQIEIGTSDANVGVVVLGSTTKNTEVRSTDALFNGNISAAGNVTGNYIIGDGSLLTGLPAGYTNAEVATFLADFGSNSIFTTGDISAGNVTLTDIYSPNYYANAVTYANATGHLTNSNLFKYNPGTEVLTVGNVSTTGNVTGGIITANILVGEGGNISNITGANVTGAVSLAINANVANIANVSYSVDGANVVGEVALANTVSNPSQPNITALGTITSLTANAINVNGLFTANGNAQFNQDVYFAGNVTLPGNINQISGNSGQFFGNAVTGFGALYAGLPAGYTLLNQEITQFAASYNGYSQVSVQNINGGDQATGDFVITADNGNDFTNHIDMGVAGSGYNGLLANNSLGTSLYANDGYLYTRGNVTGGNLVLGSNQANGVVRIIANGASNIGNVVATFSANGLAVNGNVSAETIVVNQSIIGSGASPAPTLSGFSSISTVGTQGNISASGNLLAAGYVSAAGNVIGDNILTIGQVSATGAVYGANIVLPSGALLQDGPTTILTGNYNGSNTVVGAISLNADSSIIIESNQSITLGIGATGYIDITSSGIAIDGNITASAGVGAYNLTGWNNISGNAVSASGNVTGSYIIGNGSLLTNLPAPSVTQDITSNGYMSIMLYDGNIKYNNYATVEPSTGNISGGNISAAGNITGNYIIGNGSLLTGLPAGYSDSNVVTLLTSYGSNVISTTGNVSAGYFVGDGSLLTGLPASYSDSNVVTLLSSFGSNTISTTGNVNTGNITTGTGTGGNITGVNIMSANVFIGDGGNLTNLPSSGLVVNSMTSGANITASVNDTQYNVTALAVSANVTAPTGSPQDGQKLTYRIIDDGTPQTLIWDPIYQVIGTTLPTTTVASKYVYVGVIYNAQDVTWDVVSVAQQA
jgi:hypothetical protein